jgi:DNA replication protein DnaC
MVGVRRCQDPCHLEELLHKARVPKPYWDCRLENFFPRSQAQIQPLVQARNFAANFDGLTKGLLMRGPAASGKTHLAIAIVRALFERGQRGIHVYDPVALRCMLDGCLSLNGRGCRALLRSEAAMAKLLVLDDLGGTELNHTEIGLLEHLADMRRRARRLMLITTRYSTAELSRRIGAGPTASMVAMCIKLSLASEKRNKSAKQAEVNMSLVKFWDFE